MKQYQVTGMTCAACSARVEKAVRAVPGVTGVSVSLLTNAMGVEGAASDDAIIRAVQDAGYGASVKGKGCVLRFVKSVCSAVFLCGFNGKSIDINTNSTFRTKKQTGNRKDTAAATDIKDLLAFACIFFESFKAKAGCIVSS